MAKYLDYDGLDHYTEYVKNKLSEKANSSHTHSVSDITSGTLGVARGGTGKATHTSNAVLTGNGTSAVNNVATANGALYATAANGAAKFGTLPAAQGGTGKTSLQATRNAMGLGNTTGALPIANGGTGATTAAGALANLGVSDMISALENPENNVLWSGQWYMNASQTISLSDAVSSQRNGLVIGFSYFDNEEGQNYNWQYFFVPKLQVDRHAATGVCFAGFSVDGHMLKYLYISDTSIKGYAHNVDDQTKDGVTFRNNNYVLRYVIGV